MHDVTIFMCISTLYIGGIAVIRKKTELIILAAQVAITPDIVRMQLLCTNIEHHKEELSCLVFTTVELPVRTARVA